MDDYRVIPGLYSVIPGLYPAIPGLYPVIPAKAGIQRVANSVIVAPILCAIASNFARAPPSSAARVRRRRLHP